MLFYSYLRKGSTLLLVGLASLLVGGFLYGYVDRTLYTTEQLVIIPGMVTSDTWLGLESVLVQDISEYSLYQDFTENNSAYISELGLLSAQVSPDATSPDNPNDESADGDATPPLSEFDTSDTNPGDSVPVDPSDGDSPEVGSTPSNESSLDSEPNSETQPLEPVSMDTSNTSVTWGLFPRAIRQYPLVQGNVEKEIAQTETNEQANAQVPGDNDSVTQDTESLPAETTPIEEPGDTPLEEPAPTEDETAGEETSTSESETSQAEVDTMVALEDTSNDYALVPCVVESNCTTHSMLFSDFSLPDFEGGTVLDSVQLRLSLAAQTKTNRGDGPQRFLIEYTYDTSTSAPMWTLSSVLDIDDEVSNSINGGYFLFTLNTPQKSGELANLRVKVSYQGNVADLQTAYVDGVWLDVTSGKFFEDGAGEDYLDALTYGRDLLAPEFNELENNDLDPALDTLPSFTLSYDPQQGLFNRVFQSLFGENTFVVERITLEDSAGERIDVPFEITYHDDLTWTMTAQRMPQKLRPGKYHVSVDILENDVRYNDAFEFYWGVIAINTKKSMYFPNEDVTLNLAALTDKGDTICDANLELKIIDPKGNIFEVPVLQSGSCGPNNVTHVPDYIANFIETREWGVYTIQLQHLNKDGVVVHKVNDSFEVRDYIPFDIERTAPTRIYPPAPYDVTLKVKAFRDFTGDITERVPRGFIIDGLESATVSTLPEYTLITWPDVVMKEGDERTLSYNFDAPDISPYMYLLGPLDMAGFAELRQWQIASDALNNIGWFTGTRTVANSSLNTTPSPMQWSTSSIDNYYYTHSTSSNSQRVTLRQSGDYLLSVNLPQQRTDINVSRTRAAIEVRKNGVAVPEGLGRSGQITGGNGAVHSESSSNVSFLLTQVNPNDYVEVFVENLTTIDAGDVINVTGLASMYIEYLSPASTVFAATTTKTTNSSNLNQVTAFPLEWIETRQDAGFVHSNTVTPQNITISATGTYMVHINVPLQGTAVQSNISGRVLLDGAVVSGGHFQQGYIDGPASESDADSSIHWSGVIVATTTNQVLTVTTAREGNVGTTTVPTGFVGSIMVQKLPTTGVIALRGRDLVGGTNWNGPGVTASSTRFNTQLAYDNTVFTHSTSTNNHQITINQSGDYLLNFTDAVTSPTQNLNNRITVTVGSTTVTGAQSKSNFIRALNGASDASTNLVFLLEAVTAGQIVTINTQQEAAAGVMSTTTDATLLLWKKADLNFRAPAPTMFNTPFDNARFASTTPFFDFQSNDPDGSSDIQYEFAISTSSSFSTSTVRISGTNAGFTNTASSTDTAPFIENNRVRFQLQPADTLVNGNTYYWRVRASDVSGSGQFGDWSTTQSITIDLAEVVPNWYQTLSGQFQTNSLIGSVSNSQNNNIKVDSIVSSEILVGYGDSTSATPKYRLWGGTSWGIEQLAVAVGGTINWVRTAAGVKRDEYMMSTIDQSGAAYAQVYNATSSTWGNRTLLASTVANVTRKGIAIGYESVSGDAMAVSCDTTKNPVYRIWNGSSWSATTSITTSVTGVCNFLEIASDPGSDEMILVVRDSGAAVGNNYEALVWDGSAWGNSRILGSVQNTQLLPAGITVRYESSGDQAIVAVTNNQNNNFIYAVWSGTAWSVNATQPITNDFEFGTLKADPNTDRMVLCYVDENSGGAGIRTGALIWDGSIWETFTNFTTAANSSTGRPIDCEFETTAGRLGTIMAAYSDTTGGRYRTAATSTWSAQQTITGMGVGTGVFFVQTERAGDGTIVAISHDDAASGDELESTYWNGTSWSALQSVASNPSSIIAVPYETYEMAAKRYQFTQGVVTTQPITFSSVSGQPTWGDVSFGSTEPFGTDATVRVKFTSTTTCDSYVPNGVLTGNGAGFGAEALPIVLSGLSTTTYNQLCLEATLTTFGSASASLDEWTLSWLRKPKLNQVNFRWYGNGSFLTPTDPWPIGPSDVSENQTLSATEAVNNTDVIRLRMSLQSANIALPTSTAAFKLQYAPGLSCSSAVGWADVGSSSSSTALFRGYGNSIVGSDWLSALWLKRQKVTVKSALVSGTQTDFPVYVNLADLPSTFFAGVKSDGSDIRVTQSNGITEVPFDLVAINTSTRIGELHFKANSLSTATDTDFYVYYANPSASAYAANATYGSRNVWTNSYVGVYHLLQDPTGSLAVMLDSTVNAFHASRAGTAGSGLVIDAKLGKGIDFVGTAGDYTIDFPSFGLSSSTSYTYSAWLRSSTTVNGAAADTAGTYMVDRTTGTNDLISLKAVAGNYAHQYRYGNGTSFGALSGGAITTSSWQQVVWGRSYGVNRFISVNGVVATTTDTATALTPPLMRLGGHASNTNYTGAADEVRVASTARSSGWLTTEYNNQSNATGFFTFTSEEQISDGRFLTSTRLASSTFAETYEEQNPTQFNRFGLQVLQQSEWDFVLQNNNAAVNTNYCFRMVYADGSILNAYSNYPRLITNAAPLLPVLTAPFDNRQLASTSPFFEFSATDQYGDLVSYEVVVDNNYDFSSPTLTRESNADFSLFTNLANTSQRGVYTQGQTIRFIPNTALTNGVTYWWRVRARDDAGSNTYGAWSAPKSFTINTATVLTSWFQTTGEQFSTNSLLDVVISTSTNDVGIATSFVTGTTTSTVVDYDNREVGNAWGTIAFTQNVTSGSIRHYVEYEESLNTYLLVPDADLPLNSSGFTSSPISIANLDTTTYNVIRVTSVLTGTPTLPRLQDMTITWSQKIEPPILLSLFDNAKSVSTLPALTFTTSDPQLDDLQYEMQISTNYSFTSSTTFLSGVNAGFTNVTTPADTSPYNSGNTIRYQTQTALSNGVTYYWRARARDPLGSNSWSNYSRPYSFTIDTAIIISVWHQTTGDQFATNDTVGIATTSGGAEVSTVVSGVMVAYGVGTAQAPQYRLWNGTAWSADDSALSVDAQIRWTRLKAAPTRPEYALATQGTDLDVNIQIYDTSTDTWGNRLKIFDNATNVLYRTYDIAYETTGGRLMAVACSGTNAIFSLWNGTSWTATSTITLGNANACQWVTLSSDTTSNEIIAIFKHANTSSPDYEALVWNGTSWGNSNRFGDANNNGDDAVALQYEESGNQAVLGLPNGTVNLQWKNWNGSTWSATGTVALSNYMRWANFKRDVGTDRMMLCYTDNSNNAGAIPWTGSAWGTFTNLVNPSNSNAGLPIDCEFQTTKGVDGDVVIPNADTTTTYYQTYDTNLGTYSGAFTLDAISDSFRLQTVRGGDGTIHVFAFDDGSVPSRYDTSRWNGSSWTALQSLSLTPSITTTPFDGSITAAAQTFPNFTTATIRSTPINFVDGNSPRYERIRFSDTTPGASDIKYRVYYKTATSSYALVPDSALTGNAAGFTNSPISISSLDKNVYGTLKLDAELICSSGICPSIQDWSLEWSEGLTVSGTALEYDQLTNTASGTIAVAVNGVLQVGKTAQIASGTTTQQVVFSTAGTSTFTVPAGVTNVTVKAWGAGGGAGAGGNSDGGGAGGGAGFVQGSITVIPGENLTVFIGGGGGGGTTGLPTGAGGGGGYSGITRTSTPLSIAAGGGGGGGGTGGIRYVSAGANCAVNGATCSPGIPATTAVNDVYIAVLNSRTNTAHTCTTNCTGWTEFSTQAGSLGEGRLSVWYYRQTGAVPLAPVFGGPATDTYTGRIWAFRGVTTSGNPYDVLGTNTAITTATTTFAGSNLTSTVPDAMTVFVGGSMDDNTWGPASGACTIPTTADVNFYNSTNLGTDNSLFLCYKSNPFAATGQLGTPINSQATVGPDAGRYFTFALKPEASSIAAPGSGGVGGGVTGTPGANASSSNGGGAGTQSAGGSIGGGNATVGLAYTGGNGSTGTGGGAGGAGGINGGGTGGAGASTTIDAAGGGGGAGYFGGGGGASAAGVYLSGAGGGGGSSFIATAASATSTVSGSSTLAGSNTDPDYSTGVGVGATRSATSTSGSAGNPGRVVVTWTTAASPGAWSIPNVAAFVGDTVTVFMQNASGTDEAVGVTTYDGAGDISGMQLSKRHLTIGSNDTPIVTNAQLGLYANGVNEDIFFSTSAGNTISLCAEATCSDAQLRILSGSTYTPGANSSVINFQNNGTFAPATNTLRVSGLWQQLGTFTPELSTVIFTATTSSTTLTNATTTHTFYNVTFGETSGSAVWNMAKPLITLGNLVVSQGTLARGTSTINIAGNLNLGTNGFLSGLATTTFDGTGSNTWGDAKGSTLSTNMGNVVIDGSSKTITLSDNVGAQTLTIGGDDTLNSSGSGFNINIVSAWTNNSLFIPQTGTVTFVGTSIGVINRGTSAFNNLTFSGVGGIWSFSTSTLVLNGNLTIATGTVTLPIGTTTIGGSFLNTGGTFAHNNGEVRMTSNSAGRTITQRATAFLNAFYDLVFTGSGSWSFNESAATTTRNFSIQSGTVTHPSGTLTVGGDYTVSGSGAFAHNNGEVLLLVSGQNIVSSNGSSFNNLRTRSVGVVNPRIRTFTDTNATILGNLTLEATADMVFPSGILSIGGSLANAADFTANNGTVRFNSTAGAETIAAGTSTFATLEFNNAGGIFTVTQNATATVAINLTNASAFTLQSGLTLSALGSFTNAANGSSTTWTGSILSLSGLDGAINLKSHGGDAYATILTNGDTDMIVWNSTATTYTTASSSSIYSADHAGVDGKLNIYGDYIRSTGTEFWSFATDFDGAALTGSTSRQVDVRIASSSRVGFTSASLNLVGSTLASTTIDALAGSYALSATSSTITAQNFTVAGTNVSGLQLWASTTLATFQDGFFTVVPGRSGITMSSTTVANNPSAQYQRIGFATTTAGAGINVTLVGTTSAFVWFRNGAGNLYGEDFDGADANPGSIRWDDSSNSIVISGVVYSDDGVTPLSSPTCDGVTPNVQVVVNSGSFTASTSCAVGTGAYSFASVNYLGDPKITVYLNTNGGVAGSVVTKTPTANITNMHIYANRVITRHQDVLPLTASDMQTFDFDNDSDLRFIAATTSLILLPNTELFVFASTTFAPGGNITLQGNGNANGYEGTLQIGPNATFNASSTETHTLAGRFVMATTSTFTAASSTFIFNATTTGKSITAPNTVTFNQLQFNGLGGGWNITAPLSVLADMHVATGTVTGTSNITLQNGSLYGNGVLSLGSGTTTINRTSTLGGTSAWTFNNLVLGSGLIVGTTTPASSATTTISGRLTISNAHFLNAGSAQFDLSGTGNVFVNNGTFITGTSLIRYSGNNATILGSNYYNLTLSAIAGSSTFTGTATGINVLNNLTIGGLASTTMTLLASDPVLAVGNNLTIATSGTFVASDIATTTIAGSYANTGTLISSGGRLTFIGSGTQTIAAGNSSFANITISGTGNFNVTQNATSTGSFVLDNHNNFTVTSSRTLALGGTFTNSLGSTTTTFTGSTLSFFGGGDRSINASTTSDTYDTIAVASGTNVRMWNSSAGTYTGPGGIYSQKHSGTNGLLNIYGNLTSTSANDYWSYATDFDGTSLIGGNERIANVRFASGTTATYSGGSLTVIGTSSATTTLQNQGSGTYGITIGTGATTNWNAVNIRNTNINGVVFAGAPIVTDFSRTDHLVQINGGTAITVGGTVINANEAKNFTNNIFASSSGVTGTINVTATGTSVSSWRFTNHTGNIAGEAFDSDPAGDPGYLVWDNSAALVTVAGNVYSDEAVTTSPVCDGATPNIRLVVAGLTTYDTTCNAVTGAYSIAGIAFSPLDTLTLYINGNARKAANVTVAPISSISNMNLYENRVIVRHENTSPITIANMAVWDSSDDADIQFTAVDAGSDTLTLPANNKLIIWTGKTFEPNGNVTLSGAGAGADFDGTLEAQTNAVFRAKTTETHSIGGSVLFGTGAVFTSASSTLTLTTTGSSRTFDVNANNVHNLTITGSGSYAMTDATLTLGGSYTQSNGAVTLPTGTTTIGAAFNVTGGTFNNNGGWFVFNGSGAGNTVRFNNSLVGPLTFSGSGSFNLTDLNATSTGFVLITAGTVTLPSGNFAVGGSFRKTAGTLTHNTSDIIMTATTSALLTASGSDLFAVRFIGAGPFTMTDSSITLLDSLEIASGTVALASTTTSVAGSFTATGGTFTTGTGTILLNSSVAGRTVNPGVSSFYNLQFGAPAGGYTLMTSTTTNNFTISNISSLLVNPGAVVAVGGIFTNSIGGATTTWTNTTLALNAAANYSINSRLNSGDTYGTLVIGANANVRSWYSNAATTTVNNSSSLYSQDHGNANGALNIFGNLTIATSTEYWSYARDFDGTLLSGVERSVTVGFAQNATTTVTSGELQIIGALGQVTTVQNQGTSTYTLAINGGTLNANYYRFSNLNASGLQLLGLSTITDLANGLYDLAVNSGSLVTLSSTTLNANPAKIFNNVGFTATTGLSGTNINLTGSTSNAWRFTNSYGNIGGEAFDNDGIDACGSIRFDNSSCLLTEQTNIRWRNNNGGEGATNSEWFNQSFGYRKRVRVVNADALSYATTAIKVTVAYDSDMQTNFADLRFTTGDGLTIAPHFIEKVTASTEAIVWVKVQSLPATDTTNLFMYYASSTATTTSSGTSTFAAIDDFEDNNISEYSGDNSLFQTDTTPVYGGSYALEAQNKTGRTTNGLYRSDLTTAQGQIIRWMQYVSTDGDDACTLFGFQSVSSNYALCLQRFGVDRMVLAKNVKDIDSSGTVLSSTTVTYATGWYEVEVDWRTNNSITAYLYNGAGSLVASTTATDSSYTSGGIGYTFWINNGSWDSYTTRPAGPRRPTVFFGAEQTSGGATWLAAQNAIGNALPGNTLRLRLAIENSGLEISGQQFRLEYAAKGVAPTCESVSSGSFVSVPNQASCGSSPVCMQTSGFVSDGADTTDLLEIDSGTFTSGKMVLSPSNQTSALTIAQRNYTELEYALTPTVNASDSYCFRVTNAGTPLDYYNKVAELGLQFDPTITALVLNGSTNISLTPGTTTPVTVTATVNDFNGYTDITRATTTIYRSGAGAACTPNNNNCYIASTQNGKCSFTSCSGSTCQLSCQVGIFFHADPTDISTYSGEEWLAYAEVEDAGAGYNFSSAVGVELITLRALQVGSAINYGSLEANTNTGSSNATSTITNLGNVPINVDVAGTNLTDGGSSIIPTNQQKMATSTFTYSSCVSCLQLSSSSPVTLGINLTKPTVDNPPVNTNVYWGIAVPFGINSAPHSGVNVFTAIGI